MDEVAAKQRSRAWAIHGGILGVLMIAYLVAFADSFGASGLDSLGATLVGLGLLGYAGITTLVMAFVGRRPAAPLIVHALVVVVWMAWSFAIMKSRSDEAVAAEREARARLQGR